MFLGAAAKGDLATFERLDDASKLRERDGQGFEPLHVAAAHGHAKLVHLLLTRHKLSPHSLTNVENTPLMFAAQSGDLATLLFLLKAVVSSRPPTGVDDSNDELNDALSSVSLTQTRSVAEHSCYYSVQHENINGDSALMFACMPGNDEEQLGIVKFLLASGARVLHSNAAKMNAPMCAASRGHWRLLGTLIDAAVEVEPHGRWLLAQSTSGKSMLHLAAQSGSIPSVARVLGVAKRLLEPRDAARFMMLRAKATNLTAVELVKRNDASLPAQSVALLAGVIERAMAELVRATERIAQQLIANEQEERGGGEEEEEPKQLKTVQRRRRPVASSSNDCDGCARLVTLQRGMIALQSAVASTEREMVALRDDLAQTREQLDNHKALYASMQHALQANAPDERIMHLDIRPEYLCSVRLDQLSMAQLDAIEDLHHSALKRLSDQKLMLLERKQSEQLAAQEQLRLELSSND
jgi:Ankyrin repeats (3 copies)/Ankyrin repeat